MTSLFAPPINEIISFQEKQLRNFGGNINGQTELITHYRYLKLVELIIKNGADINIYSNEIIIITLNLKF